MEVRHSIIHCAEERVHTIKIYDSAGGLISGGRGISLDIARDRVLDELKKRIDKLKQASKEVEAFDYQPHRADEKKRQSGV